MTALNRTFSLYGQRRHRPRRDCQPPHHTPGLSFGQGYAEKAPRCPNCGYVEKLFGATEVRAHCRVNRGTYEVSPHVCDGPEETYRPSGYRRF